MKRNKLDVWKTRDALRRAHTTLSVYDHETGTDSGVINTYLWLYIVLKLDKDI